MTREVTAAVNGKTKSVLRRVVCAAAAAAAVYAALRYALPCAAPFLLALATARLMEPAVCLLCSRARFTRPFASALCTLTFLLSAAGVTALGASFVYRQALEIIDDLPGIIGRSSEMLSGLTAKARGLTSSLSGGAAGYADGAAGHLTELLMQVPAKLSVRVMDALSAAARAAPKIFLFTVTYIVGTAFISRSYGEIIDFFRAQLPESLRHRAERISSVLSEGVTKWLQAELVMGLVTFTLLLGGFWLTGVDHVFFAAAFTALLDALPLLGTGTVLLPWALALAATGSVGRGAAMAVLWAATALTRSLLEPKLVGKSAGVNPAASLLALYLGFRLWGVGGMVLLPLGLVLLKRLSDGGLVRVWRDPSP